MRQNAQKYAAKPAVIFEDQQISWGQLWQRVEQTSQLFAAELDNDEQQIVALLMTNSIEFVIIYLSVLHSGHIALPLDPVYKQLEIDAILKQLQPDMLVLQPRYENQVGKHANLDVRQAAEILDSKTRMAISLRLKAEKQVASLLFTSGSSGQPKVVPNTHANHIWNIKVCSEVWGWTDADTLLLNLPLSHMHGLIIGLAGAIYHGNILYLRQQSFDAKSILEELASGRISMFTHAPIAYMRMLDVEGKYDLTKVRVMISGSAPFPPKIWQSFKDRFGVEVVETYGTTETGRIAANGLQHKQTGSPGKVLPSVDLKLSSQNEILIKSGGVLPSYWHNSKATAEALTIDGYWRTGDIGEIQDGYLYLKGRLQERIRRFGYTISPRDVEWALLENPKIKEVFVLGRPGDNNADDELVFFISGDITRHELDQYCKANLPFNWRPDQVVFIDHLPRTKNGKPSITKLKEMVI